MATVNESGQSGSALRGFDGSAGFSRACAGFRALWQDRPALRRPFGRFRGLLCTLQ